MTEKPNGAAAGNPAPSVAPSALPPPQPTTSAGNPAPPSLGEQRRAAEEGLAKADGGSIVKDGQPLRGPRTPTEINEVNRHFWSQVNAAVDSARTAHVEAGREAGRAASIREHEEKQHARQLERSKLSAQKRRSDTEERDQFIREQFDAGQKPVQIEKALAKRFPDEKIKAGQIRRIRNRPRD